jgi:ankyrin repeat protein
VQNTSQAASDSLQAPFNALTIGSSSTSSTRKLTYAEKLQAMEEREEATRKLFRAVSLNKIADVKELLEKGADPNILGTSESVLSERFPIYVAATNKFPEVLRLLIQYKANVDAVSPGCGTALHGAISFQNKEAVKELLKRGADPNKVDQTGYTPLQNAAQYADRDSGIFDALLLAEPEIDLKTSLGTALDCALAQGQFKTARRLMDRGADPDLVKDNYQHIFKYVPA